MIFNNFSQKSENVTHRKNVFVYFQVVNRHVVQKELHLETDALKLEIARLIAARKPGGQVEADFALFPTPLMAKAMLEKDCKLVGRLRMSSKPIKTVPLIVGPQELRNIHQSVLG